VTSEPSQFEASSGAQRPAVQASIIITTRNRADHLRGTLESMAAIDVPAEMPSELIVVDNGSTDATAQVVRECAIRQMPVRYFLDERIGQSNARNTGMAAASGAVIVFTDDDVRFPKSWLVDICRPILTGAADAVAGAVHLASHLTRPWMDLWQRTVLASTERFKPETPPELIGANMAFAAKVLKRVPGFDPELGPGALGFGDDSLFSQQLVQAGYKVVYLPEVAVTHHFDESRLLRTSFLDSATRHGRTWAYRGYHWEHNTVKFPHMRLLRARIRFAYWYLRHWRQTRRTEGCASWEMPLRQDIFFLKQWMKESKQPRKYEKYGLVKLPSAQSSSPGEGSSQPQA
jgi:glycosyltransferase involved in cell wall biosynthesis